MNVSGQKGKYNNEAKVTRVRIVDTVLQYQAEHTTVSKISKHIRHLYDPNFQKECFHRR